MSSASGLTREQEEILRCRARDLAIPEIGESARGASTIECLIFRVDDECFALPTEYVLGVQPCFEVVPVPDTPPELAGIVLFGGEALAVADLRVLQGCRQSACVRYVVVLGAQTPDLGLLASEALALEHLDLERTTSAENCLLANPRYVLGVTEQAVIVLDAEALLTDRAFFVDQE